MHTHRVQLGNQWLPSEVTLDIKKVRTFPIRSIIDGRRARSISTCVFRMRFRFHAISITYDFDNMRFWQLRIIVEDAFLGRCDMFLLVNVTSNDWTSLTASRSEGRAICRIGDHVKNKHQEYVKKVDLAEVKSSLTNLKRKLFSHRAKYFLGVRKCSFIHSSWTGMKSFFFTKMRPLNHSFLYHIIWETSLMGLWLHCDKFLIIRKSKPFKVFSQ